jgi:hypothetical protein
MGHPATYCIGPYVSRLLPCPQDVNTEEAQEAQEGQSTGPTEREIRSAVDRILKSRALTGCSRLAEMLTFIVSLTLGGEASQLKETTIGVSVFGRSPDYDPKMDTIVRSQAWRLRAKLKKYYAAEGARDSVVIEIPIGHYVPSFLSRRQDGMTG